MVILTGTGYTQARLAGIQHEVFVAKTGKIPPRENVIQYGDGSIILLDSGDYGLVLDETSEYYLHLPQVHKDRCTTYISPIENDIIEGEAI